MRHLKQGRKLNKKPAHRQAMFRSLAAALFRHEGIITTGPKAKELQRFAERLITVGKRGLSEGRALACRRLVASRLQDEEMARKLCEDIAPRFSERSGGYTRIIKMARVRKGDAATQVRIELTEIREQPKEKEAAEAAKK